MNYSKRKKKCTGAMLALPASYVFHSVLTFLLSVLGTEEPELPVLTRLKAVRLSARHRLGPTDPTCDITGREDKFCSREGRQPSETQNGLRDPGNVGVCQLPLDKGGSATGQEALSTTFLPLEDTPSSRDALTCRKDQPPHCDRQFLDVGIRLSRDEACLNGAMRFVADGMLTQDECDLLVKLGETGIPGSGYRKPYPLTQHELFTGVTLSDVIKGLENRIVGVPAAKLMLQAADRARLYVEAYFRLKSRLYMNFVHVVCRTAGRRSTTRRTDMSHPIHSDNCQYTKSDTCLPLLKHLIWRDFSAAIYLNDDMHGGEMVLSTSPYNSIRAVIRPRCGRMVAFNSSNPHGVLPVFSGRRCGLLLWMTYTKEMADEDWDTLADLMGYVHGDGFYRNASEPW